MNKDTLEKLSALVSEARTLVEDMETTEHDEDIQTNWMDYLETLEMEIDVVSDIMNRGTKR